METALAIKVTELRSITGWELGYGRGDLYGDPAWDVPQLNTIADMLRSAQRVVYCPTMIGGKAETHNWSFLRLLRTLPLAAAASTADLPPDFKCVSSRIWLTDAGKVITPITVSAETRVQRHLFPDTTGEPKLAEVEWRDGPSASAGQRARLHVWPTSDQAYTLQLYYEVNPEAMADERPFSYGGPEHAETFKAAAIAACEFYVFRQRGQAWEYFQDRLAYSVSEDRKLKPDRYPYMGSPDNQAWSPYGWRGWSQFPVVTINGVTPE